MDFPFGQTVYRDRRKTVIDPYSEAEAPGDWEDPDTIELESAFVASSSTSGVPSATRSQTITTKSLYLSDPTADVQAGDRIRWGASTLQVDAVPEADINPFTGWQPAIEIPLTEVLG